MKIEFIISRAKMYILINNAGLAYPYARFMHEVDDGLMESVVGVNAAAATWVTRAAVAGMLERGRGAIVNVGSAPLPAFPRTRSTRCTPPQKRKFVGG